MQTKSISGTVLRIERGSIYDGDGSRTVIYLKGCNMRCAWCSTPESHSFDIEQVGDKTYGKVMTTEDVMKIVRKDSLFYFNSGGGVTLSGGEVLCQPNFARAIAKTCRKEGYHTTIETAFNVSWDNLEMVLKNVDQAYVDIKFFDEDLHRKYTKTGNNKILENLIRTNDLPYKFDLRIRVPIVPGLNDCPEELEQIAKFCQKLDKLEHIEVLAYHRLGLGTYKEMGIPYKLGDIETPSPEYMEDIRSFFNQYVPTIFINQS